MKTLALLGVAAFTIACDSPTSPRALLKAPTTTSNAVVSNDRIEYDLVTGDCEGGTVNLTLKSHSLVAVTADNGGGFHFVEHSNTQGQGSNPVTGADYVVNEETNIEFNMQAGSESTGTDHYNLIAKGDTPNLLVQSDAHYTITPDGEFSSYHNNFRVVCQGS